MKNNSSKLIIFFVAACILSYFAYLQSLYPCFYDPDSYYNIAISNFIKNSGFNYKFHWAQFSSLKDSYSDRDLLLHIFTMPFLYLVRDPLSAGKYALVFYMGLFIIVYIYILKKYLPDFLAALFLLLPFLSSVFSSYFLELRTVTLVNIFVLLGIYFIINKKLLWIFIISVLYALAHTSFFILAIFAFICEILRYKSEKEFSAKTIYTAIAGSVIGCLIHPNFPNNIFNAYLNSILVPYYTVSGADLGFSGETKAIGIQFAIINNFSLILSLIIVFSALIIFRKKMSLATRIWLTFSGIYLIFAALSLRYWYQANAVFFIFFASYVNDWIKNKDRDLILRKTNTVIFIYLTIIIIFLPYNLKQLTAFIKYSATRNNHYENAGRWMQKHLPENRTIYHSYWDDASYFICLNPKNNYLNTNDPIYMFYRYPREFDIMNNLSMGRVGNPDEVISKIFKADYGYLRKGEPLYRQIKDERQKFRILYEDNEGVVFTLLK